MPGPATTRWEDAAVVIPALNEARTVRAIASGALDYSRTVIVIDDGSSDGTSKALCGLPVTLVRHETPRGKADALRHGFTLALERGCKGIVTLDADGQHKPEDLPELLRLATENPASLVIAARRRNLHTQPKLRRFANRCADFWISWAAGQPIVDTQSGMRYYPADVAQLALTLLDRDFAFESQVLIAASLDLATPILAVSISACYEPEARRSHFRPIKDVAAIARTVAKPLLGRERRLDRFIASRRQRLTIPQPALA